MTTKFELKDAEQRARMRRMGQIVLSDDDYHDPTSDWDDDHILADEYIAMIDSRDGIIAAAINLCESLGRCTILKGESATMDVEKDLWKLRQVLVISGGQE